MSRKRALSVFVVVLLAVACTGPTAPGVTPTGQPTPGPTPTASATTSASASASASPSAGTTESVPPPTGSAEPTPNGSGTPLPSPTPNLIITSPDGVVTVDVPDGALPPGTTISVGLREADQSPPELVTAGIPRQCYALEPEGTIFNAPVKVTMTRPRNFYGNPNEIPLIALATRTAEGAWEWLSDAAFWLPEGDIAIAGFTDHFSCLYDWSDRTNILVDPPAPRADRVGDMFTRLIEARSRDERVHEINFTNVIFYNYTPAIVSVGPDTSGTPSAPKSIISRLWTCLAVGEYNVEFWATINEFAADNPFWATLGLGANVGAIKIELNGLCTDDEGLVDTACIVVHHEEFGEFVSWLEFQLWFFGGYDVDFVEVTLQGANDEEPVVLTPDADRFTGQLGLRNAGPKQLQRVLVHLRDGGFFDVTDEVRENLGDIVVEFPAENVVGECR